MSKYWWFVIILVINSILSATGKEWRSWIVSTQMMFGSQLIIAIAISCKYKIIILRNNWIIHIKADIIRSICRSIESIGLNIVGKERYCVLVLIIWVVELGWWLMIIRNTVHAADTYAIWIRVEYWIIWIVSGRK